jgi:hypothetical protein
MAVVLDVAVYGNAYFSCAFRRLRLMDPTDVHLDANRIVMCAIGDLLQVRSR